MMTRRVMSPKPLPHADKPKKIINLLRGWPSPHLLPAPLLKDAAMTCLSDPSLFVSALQYGPDLGYQPLREQLAAWLSATYSNHIDNDPDKICITGGASQSVACVLQSLTDPGYTLAVWIVAPCYYLACPIFDDAGFAGRLKAVAEDGEGMDVKALKEGMVKAEREAGEVGKGRGPIFKNLSPFRKAYRHVIYTVPTCANPSGTTMSLARREAVVRLARAHDAIVICDDVYDFLQWPVLSSPPPAPPQDPESKTCPLPPLLPRLSDIDSALGPSPHDTAVGKHFGHAISNGSFSKLVGPGCRTGWVAGTKDFVLGLAQTGSTRSGGAPSQLVATMLCEMLRAQTLQTHLSTSVRPALQTRHALALHALRTHVEEPLGMRLLPAGTTTYGGYFLWLTLPSASKLSAQTVAERAKTEENLIVAQGRIFEVKGDEMAARFPQNIRLCFAWEDEEDVYEGIERLGRLLRRMNAEDEWVDVRRDDGMSDDEFK